MSRHDGVVAGAAALDVTVAEHAAAAGLAGLEFLSGIPGTIGGAVAMNAGAYGGEIAAVLDWAEIVTALGRHGAARGGRSGFRLSPCRAAAGRRRGARAPSRQPGDAGAIAARMAEIRQPRDDRSRSARAPAARPSATRPDMKAWELIDAAGCRGLTRGGAQVSEKHCNFLINTGDATAADIEAWARRCAAACCATGVDAGLGNPPHRMPLPSRPAAEDERA